jgi:putative heme-binding domain-containing protein
MRILPKSRSQATTALLALIAVLIAPLPVRAQRGLTQIPDPDPEIERRSFQVAEGFEVNLFAADPILAKPLQINFDPAGRLWVVSSEVYPQIQPGQVANDKVLILEDRDGDGRADRTSVFADGLLIPTGIEPGDGGAYVANSTELLHFKDTDGDGKADRRRVLLSGFGTEDTHHILHTLRWGPDGRLYFNQSIYIHSHIETPYGVRRLGGGGIWQFRPESVRLEVFARGLVNPWGHHFDPWGQQFWTDGAGGEGINYMIPGASYVATPGETRIVAGLNPGSPKYCGAEVVSGRHLPDAWQGNILTNDFRANRVCRFVLSDDSSGFAAREQVELIKTPHVAFRPIDVKMGPDGAIYVADWYNPIIQHGEVDFRDPRRDHTRGRIWRVTAKGRPLVERPRLVEAPVASLLDALKAPEDWTRHHAKRVLKERGQAAVVPALATWLKGLDAADPGVWHHRLEGLWVYQSLDVVEPGLLSELHRSPDPRVRAAATRVLGDWSDRIPDRLDLLAERVVDDHPRVRLEAVRALAKVPSAKAVEIALRALDRPVDKFLDYALWLTARDLAPRWVPEAQKGQFDFGGDPKHLLFALQAAGSPAVVPPLMEMLKAGAVPASRRGDVLQLIAAVGGPNELARVLDLALAEGPRADSTLLDALVQTTRPRRVKPSGDLARLALPLASGDEAARAAAARAAGAWQVESLRPRLEELARVGATSEPIRLAAIDGLAGLGGPKAVAALDALAGSDGPAAVCRASVIALAGLDPQAGARRAVEVLAHARAGNDPAAIVAAFLGRRGGPAALATALADRSLPPDVAKLGLRAARQSGRPDPGLEAALTRAGGLSGGPVELSAAELERLADDVRSHGDAARGEAIFRRADLGCLKCHGIAGAGGRVGPGLESIGASAPVDYLVTSLLQPDKSIKEGYHSTVVATDDGRVVSGIKVRQTDSQVVLRDADDREVTIPLSSVEDQKPGGSLMPAGLTDTLTRPELVDLVRFLSELGKIGPYAVGKARVVRRWQRLEPTPEAVSDVRRKGSAAALDVDLLTWSPAYSTVAGLLPLDDVPAIRSGSSDAGLGAVRCTIDVTTSGKVALRLNSPDALEVWVDGHKTEPGGMTDLDLSTGPHVVTFAVDLSRRREGLRCELEDVPGSPARAQVVGGK